MKKMKETRPSTTPIPVRFTESQLAEIEAVAEEFGMSRAEIIRLSCAAGLVALKELGEEGLIKAVSQILTNTATN